MEPGERVVINEAEKALTSRLHSLGLSRLSSH